MGGFLLLVLREIWSVSDFYKLNMIREITGLGNIDLQLIE